MTFSIVNNKVCFTFPSAEALIECFRERCLPISDNDGESINQIRFDVIVNEFAPILAGRTEHVVGLETRMKELLCSSSSNKLIVDAIRKQNLPKNPHQITLKSLEANNYPFHFHRAITKTYSLVPPESSPTTSTAASATSTATTSTTAAPAKK